ncbi:L,D-transpeptidase [Halobacillus salinus]|uniref:L,D-transpeptidase n=1 Tax=Halobacillus salinus TaxID=192814 RepID=UPI0009A7C05D|nr:L,D-transpeptidase [Halobacillus salinus]
MSVLLLLFVLHFVPGSFQEEPVLIVNKATHEVALFENGEQRFQAAAAIGKTDDLTPEGTFDIVVKAKDPYYRKKDIPGGDAKNPLGSRWIGFDARGTDGRIYGVHGTNNPSSVGKSVSAGCIRLKNDDVNKLYELIDKGSEIVIVNQEKSFGEVYDQWLKKNWGETLTK